MNFSTDFLNIYEHARYLPEISLSGCRVSQTRTFRRSLFADEVGARQFPHETGARRSLGRSSLLPPHRPGTATRPRHLVPALAPPPRSTTPSGCQQARRGAGGGGRAHPLGVSPLGVSPRPAPNAVLPVKNQMETTCLLFPLKLNSHNDLLENLTKKKKKKVNSERRFTRKTHLASCRGDAGASHSPRRKNLLPTASLLLKPKSEHPTPASGATFRMSGTLRNGSF